MKFKIFNCAPTIQLSVTAITACLLTYTKIKLMVIVYKAIWSGCIELVAHGRGPQMSNVCFFK